MKSLFFLLAAFILIAGCKKQEPNQYSCDPVVNSWVENHKTTAANISRNQLVTLPIAYQKAVYRSFPNNKKSLFWKEKLNIVKDSISNTSYAALVEDLIDSVVPDIFDRDSLGKPADSVTNYIDNWEHTILSSYEPDTAIFSINFCTLMTLGEFDYYVENYDTFDYSWLEDGDEIIVLAPGGSGGSGEDCTCRYDVYCSVFFNNECEDEKNGCNEVWDCGIASQSKCNGMCEENVDPTL